MFDMETIVVPNHKVVAVECFKHEHGKDVKIIRNRHGIFGIIKGHIMDNETKPMAIPIYVEYHISRDYLIDLYNKNV